MRLIYFLAYDNLTDRLYEGEDFTSSNASPSAVKVSVASGMLHAFMDDKQGFRFLDLYESVSNVKDRSGKRVYNGSLLTYGKSPHRPEFDNKLILVRHDGDNYISHDGSIITEEYLYNQNLYVAGHIASYKGNELILNKNEHVKI